ncbi:hypothetical protein PCPL58_p4081 (plasmid) [Pseudomonas cerasi]|nr:hypothetical protein PCPL58_p4081 [Pseudomonas cerasi]
MQVLDHAQQLGTVGSSARGLFAIDRSHVVARCSRIANDRFLAQQVLVFGTDTQVHPRNIESRHYMAHFGIPKRAELISHGSLGLNAILKSHSEVSYPFEPYRTPEAGLTLVFCSVAPSPR